jgi:hypothetical protein
MPSALASWSRPTTPRDLAARAFWSDSHPINMAYRRANPGKSFTPSDLRAFIEAGAATLVYVEQEAA